jgi:hypothetical protein
MWKYPKCNREFDNEPPHHFCDNGAVTIDKYIAGQAENIQPRLWAGFDNKFGTPTRTKRRHTTAAQQPLLLDLITEIAEWCEKKNVNKKNQ